MALVAQVAQLEQAQPRYKAIKFFCEQIKHGGISSDLMRLVEIANNKKGKNRTLCDRTLNQWVLDYEKADTPEERLKALAPMQRVAKKAEEILHYQAFALSPDNSIAIGNGSKIIGANSAIAIGNKADVTAIDGGRGSAANNAIAIGNQATVRRSNSISLGKGVDTAGENSVSIGVNIQSAKNNSITIGQNAKTSQERTIAIGAYADANSDRTVAIGAEAKAYGSKSIVIGGLGERGSDKQAQSKVGARSSIVIGNGSIADTSAQHSIVLGSDAKVSSSQGISIGKNAKVLANSLGAISIGTNATTSHAQDIAIGQNSETSTPNNLSTLTIGDQSLQKGVISTVNTGVVSVGNSTTKRQIQNVAAGNVSENSTDAINGSQLYYVVKAADEI
ncbi:conserved hypothetical protein, partial [Haemophilus influenzae HK1212]